MCILIKHDESPKGYTFGYGTSRSGDHKGARRPRPTTPCKFGVSSRQNKKSQMIARMQTATSYFHNDYKVFSQINSHEFTN